MKRILPYIPDLTFFLITFFFSFSEGPVLIQILTEYYVSDTVYLYMKKVNRYKIIMKSVSLLIYYFVSHLP